MLLHIIKLAVLEHRRRHILIGDALIGQDGRRQLMVEIHLLQPVIILFCDPVIACPQLLCFPVRQSLKEMDDLFCLFHKSRQSAGRQIVSIYIHLLCR